MQSASTRSLPTMLVPRVAAQRERVVCASSAVSKSLISVLKDELKYERENYRPDETLVPGPPNDFELDNPPGKNAFYLLKVWC
eukprot:297846-Chlamydomonas_euryale.AAC.13